MSEKERKHKGVERDEAREFKYTGPAGIHAKKDDVTGRKTAGDAAMRKKNTEFELKVNEKFRKVKETREKIISDEAH